MFFEARNLAMASQEDLICVKFVSFVSKRSVILKGSEV